MGSRHRHFVEHFLSLRAGGAGPGDGGVPGLGGSPVGDNQAVTAGGHTSPVPPWPVLWSLATGRPAPGRTEMHDRAFPTQPGGYLPLRASDVPSPCVKICRMDPLTGLCEGCLRTREEIARWGVMSAEQKLETLNRIETRRR